MASRRAEHEQARANNSRKTKIEASERGKKADNGETETCRCYLELEWAVGPTDEGRRHPSEEAMHYEVVEIADADSPEYVPGEQLFDDDRSGLSASSPE